MDLLRGKGWGTGGLRCRLTLFGPLEAHVELLHVVVDERDFVVAHQHLHDVCLDSALGTRHFGG